MEPNNLETSTSPQPELRVSGAPQPSTSSEEHEDISTLKLNWLERVILKRLYSEQEFKAYLVGKLRKNKEKEARKKQASGAAQGDRATE